MSGAKRVSTSMFARAAEVLSLFVSPEELARGIHFLLDESHFLRLGQVYPDVFNIRKIVTVSVTEPHRRGISEDSQ